jgi:tetratricopeptide (TPR) repeat protein
LHDTEANSARSSFERATTYLKSGDATTSENICRGALEQYPRDANLLCLLGATLIKQQKAGDAEEPLKLAARLIPNFAAAHEGLAEVYILQNRLRDALPCLERARELDPHRSSVQLKLGRVLAALGRSTEADKAFEASFRLTPYREELVRGLELQRAGHLKAAEKVYRGVLVKNPDDVDAMRLLSGLAMRASQWRDAEAMLKRALELAPDFYQGWMDLGLAQQELDKLDEAQQSYRRAGRLEPAAAAPHVAIGTTLAMSGRHAEAETAFRQALEREPRNAGSLTGLGHVLKTVGKQEEAIRFYRDCISHNPLHGEAWWSMANLKTFRFTDGEVETMRQHVNSEAVAGEPRVNFLFALGAALEDREQYAEAFEYYRAGNELRRERENYDPVQTCVIHDQIIESFDREFIAARQGQGHPGNAPIFIVGLPRSGSTLIEQILASHSQVEGTHELPEISRLARSTGRGRADRLTYPQSVTDLSQQQLHDLGQKYLDRTLRHRTGETPRFTDKMPNNFAHVGFIKTILPNAKIINARRHPLDSCLGSYKQLFARGQPFTYDLYEIGEYYLEYQRMMDYWHEVFPRRVLDVQYEEVVADLDGQVRTVLEFCELPFEDDCLRFHETRRAVKTASSEQVRQPIYSAALHRWRNYQEHLTPLIDVLEPLLRGLPEDWQPASLCRL